MDNGELNGVVFPDIRKTFDSINHTILLHKMKVQFGITNAVLDWFSSYLTNREQVCLVNGITSTPKKIVCGVQQGSILGPLLFLLYINDLPDCLDKTTPCLYADDTHNFSAAKHLEKLIENINHDMNKLRKWLIRNKLQHHPPKTKVMHIGSWHNLKIMNNDLPVVRNNQLVPRERSFTCPAVKLDETLE
jgi:retron-type reverse transcriptase